MLDVTLNELLQLKKRGGIKIINRFRLRFQNYWTKTGPFMAILGILYLVMYSIQVVYWNQTRLVDSLEVISNGIWIIFVLDAALRAMLADNLKVFFRTSWLEIIALAIPVLRGLRMLRILVALRGVKPFLKSRTSTAGGYVLFLLPITWFCGAIAVLDVERSGPQPNISNLPDALWWSLSTITTVGYGEFYPTTPEGKFIAGLLMVAGIALFSVGAGMFAGWIVGEKKIED